GPGRPGAARGVGDARPAPRRVALAPRQRLRYRIFCTRHTHEAADRDDRGRQEPHPKTSLVIVRNHASARTASAARVARGASEGLTPPEPGTSASCPLDG